MSQNLHAKSKFGLIYVIILVIFSDLCYLFRSQMSLEFRVRHELIKLHALILRLKRKEVDCPICVEKYAPGPNVQRLGGHRIWWICCCHLSSSLFPHCHHLSSIFQWIFLRIVSHSSRGNKTIMTKCCFQVLCGKCYARLTDSTGSFGAWRHGLSQPWKTDSFCKDEILEVLEEPAQLHFYIWYDLIWFYIWQHCNMHATWQNNSSDRAFFMPLLPWCWWFRARRHRGTGGKKNTPLQFL